ncbi:MAG TPA: hypothetical protein PKC60_02355 [Hydrogenophaga sp.]|nr:hypothetical protein [Hydrogenophaga sp.]HMN92049.1 hypothetical protein [Hydrogenophaga sp.]HMP11901.1 hypothetical protein [Hydrogenophaga sp.]
MFDARSFMTTRATLAALVLLLALAFWRCSGGGVTVEREAVSGVVLPSDAPSSGASAAALATVRVELGDGRQVRVLVTGAMPAPGETVQLWRSRTDQGGESYSLQVEGSR